MVFLDISIKILYNYKFEVFSKKEPKYSALQKKYLSFISYFCAKRILNFSKNI